MIRKLATIQTITKLEVHPNADKLDIAHVKGWSCVVIKGSFTEGEKVVFIEPDAVLPEGRPEWEFMRERGFRIKTIKLRKVLSQGLVFNAHSLLADKYLPLCEQLGTSSLPDETDVTDLLGITKYEPYVPAQLSGMIKGNFPEFLHKTDEERVNNIPDILEKYKNNEFYMTEKLDGCFPYHTYLPTWDGKHVTIGQLVNKNLSPTLIGIDNKGNLVPTEILKRFNNGKKEKWLEVKYTPLHHKRAGKKEWTIFVTPNHKIFTERGEIFANDLRVKDNLISYAPSPSIEAHHVFESSLLGDGCLHMDKRSESCRYSENHKVSHSEYIDEIIKWIGDCYGNENLTTTEFNSIVRTIWSKSYHSLHDLYKKWYPKGKKVVPQDLSWIDDFSVAKWYMDDGSLHHQDKQHDRARFATNGFEKEDVIRLANVLTEKYGVATSVCYSKGWEVHINWNRGTIHNFWKAIDSYIVPCMRYKLPQEYRVHQYISPFNGNEILKTFYSPIVKITDISNKKKKFSSVGYDIETTTHNYMCNGILVHNSSMTVYLNNGEFGVCSRNLDLKETEDNTFWKTARALRIEQALRGCGNYAIQGEILGQGIQGNKYNMAGVEFRIFNVYDIDARKYLDFEDFKRFVAAVHLDTVPMLGTITLQHNTDQILELVKGNSVLNKNTLREGVVFRPLIEMHDSYLGRLSFKGINSEFLLQYGE